MNKRTLGLTLGLVVTVLLAPALMSGLTRLPQWGGILDVLFLVLFAAYVNFVYTYRPVFPRDRIALRDWAETQGCTLLRCSRSLVYERQSMTMPRADGELYRVLVRRAGGRVRWAWVRLKQRDIMAEYPEVVRFRWDDAV